MVKASVRLVSAAAASRMLQITVNELELLCAKGVLTKYRVSNSLTQYDFQEIAEHRKKSLNGAIREPSIQALRPALSLSETPKPKPIELSQPNSEKIKSAEQFQVVAQNVILRKKIECELRNEDYKKIELNVIKFLVETPLYCKGTDGSFVLYKQSGTTLVEGRNVFPDLYISKNNKKVAFKEMQSGLNEELRLLVDSKKVKEVKSVIINLLDITLCDSEADVFEGLEDTVEILVSAVSKSQDMVMNLLSLIELSAEVITHSVRIMAFVLKFCLKNNYSLNDTKLLCLSALLHDIGRTQLPDHLVSITYEDLDEQDKIVYQSHPQIGYELLKEVGVANKAIVYGALEHHERLDGSGFPLGKKKLSFIGQLIGIVDEYDTLRNKPFSNGGLTPPLEVLKLLKQQCEQEKFSRELFEGFVYSLL